MTTVGIPDIRRLTDAEIADAWHASGGTLDLAAITAEMDRRDRADRARTAARARHAEWEAAAYAQYLAVEEYARGNLLSAAGKRRGRDAWPMCWQGSEETARRLASDELITYWDYVAPRVPGPGSYAAAKRGALTEGESRALKDLEPAARMSGIEAAEAAALGHATPPAAPGSIARYMAALTAFGGHADRLAARLTAARGRIERSNVR